MAIITFVDIPVLAEELEMTVKLRFEAQDRINLLAGVPKPLQKNRKQFSRGILVLSGYLKQKGRHEIRYFQHADIHSKAFSEAISVSDFMGITGNNSAYFNLVKDISTFIKNERSDIPVVVGGYHVTAMDIDVLKECESITYVVRGEGELPFLELVNGEKPQSIKGLTYREGTSIIRNPSQTSLAVDELAQPDYSILPGDLNDYNFNIQTVRGCIYRCAFCSNGYFWETTKPSPLQKIMDEISFLNSRLKKGTIIHFSDNIFSLDRQRAIQLLDEIIDRKIELVFSCDLKANHVDEMLIKKMKMANFVKISLGFEDANDHVLNKSNKGLSFEDNVHAARTIKQYSDILVEAYWIIGLPGSTHKSIYDNLSSIRFLLRQNIVDVISSSLVFTPLPGTPMFDDSRSFGITILTKDWGNYLRNQLCPVYELDTLTRADLRAYNFLYEETILNEYRNILARAQCI